MHGPLPSPPPRMHITAFRTRDDDDDDDDDDASKSSSSAEVENSPTSRSSRRRCLGASDDGSMRGRGDDGGLRRNDDVGRRRHEEWDEGKGGDAASAVVAVESEVDDVSRTVRASIERGWIRRFGIGRHVRTLHRDPHVV